MYRPRNEPPLQVPVNRASKREPRADRPGAFWPVPPPISPINLAIPLDPETAARVRRSNERAWVDTTEIATPSWPVILVGSSGHEHELVRQRHPPTSKQEKTP
jgi:hypothetical protein